MCDVSFVRTRTNMSEKLHTVNDHMSEKLLMRSRVGERLRLERERLGLSQLEFGGVGGVSRRTQVAYEAGEQTPNTDYLAAIRVAGANLGFVLMGENFHTAPALDELEWRLIKCFRSMSETAKAAIVHIVEIAALGDAKAREG